MGTHPAYSKYKPITIAVGAGSHPGPDQIKKTDRATVGGCPYELVIEVFVAG